MKCGFSRMFSGLVLLLLLIPAEPQAQIDAWMSGGLRWRSIGPSRGGRSQAGAGSAARPLEYYFGATGGGVWKTTDGGITWRPVSDKALKLAAGAYVVQVGKRRFARVTVAP